MPHPNTILIGTFLHWLGSNLCFPCYLRDSFHDWCISSCYLIKWEWVELSQLKVCAHTITRMRVMKLQSAALYYSWSIDSLMISSSLLPPFPPLVKADRIQWILSPGVWFIFLNCGLEFDIICHSACSGVYISRPQPERRLAVFIRWID